jgi:hypothetical protein
MAKQLRKGKQSQTLKIIVKIICYLEISSTRLRIKEKRDGN